MRYEERILDGRLYWRTSPGSKWLLASHEMLVNLLIEAREKPVAEGEKKTNNG